MSSGVSPAGIDASGRRREARSTRVHVAEAALLRAIDGDHSRHDLDDSGDQASPPLIAHGVGALARALRSFSRATTERHAAHRENDASLLQRHDRRCLRIAIERSLTSRLAHVEGIAQSILRPQRIAERVGDTAVPQAHDHADVLVGEAVAVDVRREKVASERDADRALRSDDVIDLAMHAVERIQPSVLLVPDEWNLALRGVTTDARALPRGAAGHPERGERRARAGDARDEAAALQHARRWGVFGVRHGWQALSRTGWNIHARV